MGTAFPKCSADNCGNCCRATDDDDLLFGDARKWIQAKKLLVDAADADYLLFIELRAMTAEERDAYFNSLRSLNAGTDGLGFGIFCVRLSLPTCVHM